MLGHIFDIQGLYKDTKQSKLRQDLRLKSIGVITLDNLRSQVALPEQKRERETTSDVLLNKHVVLCLLGCEVVYCVRGVAVQWLCRCLCSFVFVQLSSV